VSGDNTLITANADGDGVGGDRAMLAEDGNRLAFWSYAADITSDDTNDLWDIFVYQHDDGSYRRVSLRADGGERNQGNESISRVVTPSISGDGRYVAYATTSTNVVEGDTNEAQDVFLVDLDSDEVQRMSVNDDGEEGDADSPTGQGERIAISYDGAWLAFSSNATNFGAAESGNIFLRGVEPGELRAVTDLTSGVGAPALSRTGAFVVFGAGSVLDARYDSSGLFAHFTDVALSWWWVE
jgi:hypothetical protein